MVPLRGVARGAGAQGIRKGTPRTELVVTGGWRSICRFVVSAAFGRGDSPRSPQQGDAARPPTTPCLKRPCGDWRVHRQAWSWAAASRISEREGRRLRGITARHLRNGGSGVGRSEWNRKGERRRTSGAAGRGVRLVAGAVVARGFAAGGVTVVGGPADVAGAGRDDGVPGEGAGVNQGGAAEAANDEATIGSEAGNPEC